MRYVIEVFRSSAGVHGSVVDAEREEGIAGPRTPFHGWLELLSLLEPPDAACTEAGERACAAGDDSCDT
ncbi:hypothetical protein [Streptomyces sp. NPDC051218]|uniref:hypothetical protein n=1 Tax=Streptomyces sp. NPDC051218 TaxID=3365645 RepID=UPI0037BDC951